MHLGNMLDDILFATKAQTGHLKFEPALHNLDELCRNLVEHLQSTVGAKHQLVYTSKGKLDEVLIDEKLLQYILTNLLTNAIKYSPEGEEIHLNLLRRDEKAIFQVSDKGIGIPAEDQKHLFEPYHRASNVETIQGIGLGLAIVKDCVELHHGEIKVESVLGAGSTFEVALSVSETGRARETGEVVETRAAKVWLDDESGIFRFSFTSPDVRMTPADVKELFATLKKLNNEVIQAFQ